MTLLGAHQSPSVNASPHMTPVHFLALIDPIASWFTKWMVGGAFTWGENDIKNPISHCRSHNKEIIC